MQNEKHKITVSNGVFLSKEYTIRGKFRNAATLIYKSKILKMDFQNQPENSTISINKYIIFYCKIILISFNYNYFAVG